MLVQLAERAATDPLVQRVPEAPIREVENGGLARAQMTPPLRVGTDEHAHQATISVANMRG